MKKILFILLVSISTLSNAQNFEGVLTYKIDIEVSEKMKEMGMTKEIVIQTMKDSKTYFENIAYTYKNDSYCIDIKDVGTKSIYNAKDNKIYTIQKKEDIIVATDTSIDLEQTMTGKYPEIKEEKEETLIFKKPCRKISVIWGMGTYEYYYSSNFLKIDAELYKNHIYDGWYDFLKLSSALPVRIVKRQMGLTITLTLVSINEDKIHDRIFELPKMKLDKDMAEFAQKNQTIYTKK